MYFVFLLVGVLFCCKLVAQSDSLSNCNEINSCEFYDCIEQYIQCGKKGYPKRFGKKHCSKFVKNRSKFSEEGQKWVDATLNCLIEELYQLAPGLSCKELKKSAFNTHAPCFIGSGYCNLNRKDKRLIFKILIFSLYKPKVLLGGIKVKCHCFKARNKNKKLSS